MKKAITLLLLSTLAAPVLADECGAGQFTLHQDHRAQLCRQRLHRLAHLVA